MKLRWLVLLALAAASLLIWTGPALASGNPSVQGVPVAVPSNFPTYFIMQVKDRQSSFYGEWINDVHGRGQFVGITSYHHTPYHMAQCHRDQFGHTWCLFVDEHHLCLGAAVHPASHTQAGVLSNACNSTSFYQQWRFVRNSSTNSFWMIQNRHYVQFAVPNDVTSCDVTGSCAGDLIMSPVHTPWAVERA